MLWTTVCGIISAMLWGCGPNSPEKTTDIKRIVVSTFPVYQLTRNIVRDYEGASVELMLPAQLGCPHDYALTPQDMRKLAKADVLVINGLGLEGFLAPQLQNAEHSFVLIDSSQGIDDLLMFKNEEACRACDHHADHSAHPMGDCNPHLFSSPKMAAQLTINIATQLSEIDPEGAPFYTTNAMVYAETLNRLAEEMANRGAKLKNKRMITTHGIFDYLARDLNLEIVIQMQPHGQEPSASEMITLAKMIKEQQVGGIFTEPQYSQKIGMTLARETGIAVGMLDPMATGPKDASLDYYENIMRQNMRTLEQTLGTNP